MKWCCKNIHGIAWDSYISEGLPQKSIQNYLKDVIGSGITMVKGLKKRILEKLLSYNIIINMDRFGCPTINTLKLVEGNYNHCNLHKNN